MTPGNSSLAAA